jgi:hypothetical protein
VDKLKDFLRISEAAEYLGVSSKTRRNWENAAKIVAHRHPVNGYHLPGQTPARTREARTPQDMPKILLLAERGYNESQSRAPGGSGQDPERRGPLGRRADRTAR